MKKHICAVVVIVCFYTGMFTYNFASQTPGPSKPKVLVCTYQFPYFVQTFVLKHMLYLIDQGYDISINAWRKGGREDLSPEIATYRLLDKKITREEWKRAADTYDIILAEFGNLGSDILEEGLVDDKTVFAVCFRGMETFKMINWYPDKLARLFERADIILPNCDFFRDKLIAAGCDQRKIVTLHEGVDCKKFKFQPTPIPTDGSKIRIVSVGRLVEKKGHFDSIDAVAKVIEKYPNVIFEILGYGKLENNLKKYIHSLGLQDHIALVGGAQNDEVIQFLRGAHIFIHPSKTARDGDEDATPCAIYEAMSAGVPVVSTYHGGIAEVIVDGQFGLLAQEGDVQKLAEHLEFYLKNPESALRIAHAARQRVEQRAFTERLRVELDQHLMRAYNRKKGTLDSKRT